MSAAAQLDAQEGEEAKQGGGGGGRVQGAEQAQGLRERELGRQQLED